MKNIKAIHGFKELKLLADPRRLDILRRLMAGPATLTHLARGMRQSPAWVRHHMLALQAAGLVEVTEVRKTGRVTEKFYHAKADALLIQELVLPRTKGPTVIFSGSHDLALEAAGERLRKHITLISLPVGSLDGLVNLRQGLCQISGSHLLDETGEYNTPFVRHLFPDRAVEIVTLAYRTQGLMLAADNPKDIRNITDLVRTDVRFVNRNPGSGTRLWLDTELRKLNILPKNIRGYANTVLTHSEAAAWIANKNVDAALGLQAAAHQHALAFIPLFEERYDLVLTREHEKPLSPILEYIQTAAFRRTLRSLPGYDASHSGEQIPL